MPNKKVAESGTESKIVRISNSISSIMEFMAKVACGSSQSPRFCSLIWVIHKAAINIRMNIAYEEAVIGIFSPTRYLLLYFLREYRV